MNPKPTLLFYCQHSLGLGHLVRSLALADGLAEYFDVVLLNGGRLPLHTAIPDGVELINLAPLGHDEHYELVSHDPAVTVAEAQRLRTAAILDALARRRPAVVLLELFPFGRKKFAFELDPLLEAIARIDEQPGEAAGRPKVVCSLRDILVNQRRDQARHDERAALKANAHLDAIVVHTDPTFARLEESFRPATALRIPVLYTGFVTGRRVDRPAAERQRRVLVSCGGGMVGEPLIRAAVDAHRAVWEGTGLTTTVVAGPFLPEDAWNRLRADADASPLLTAIRQVPDLAGEIAASAVSVSQCGYNTTMDLLRARTPAVVVPFSEGKEDEQRRRAERLVTLGVVESVSSDALDGSALAAAIGRAAARTAPSVTLDLSGRESSARRIAELAGLLPVAAGVAS